MKTDFPTLVLTPHRPGSVRWSLSSALQIAAAIILTATFPSTHGAVTEGWVARYNNVVSNANGGSSMIVRDEAGDVIVVGYASDGVGGQDMLTIKYSGANGSVLWQQRYNGPANGNDVAQAVAVDSSGNVVVTGYSYVSLDPFGGLIHDYYTAKYASADGALLWERRYHDPDIAGASTTALAVDGTDNVVVIGSRHTAKYAAADGALLWVERYPSINLAAVLDAGGNVVVRGDRSALKYAAADGRLLWERAYALNVSIVASAVDRSGNLVVTGFAGDGRNNNWYTAKYAVATGALLWEKRGGFAMAFDIGGTTALAVDIQGNVVVTGYSTTGFQGWGWPVFTEYYTAKYAAAGGALLWSKIYPTWEAATFDGNDNVSAEMGNRYAKFAAANGALLSEGEFSFPNVATKVWDGSGNVVVTGGRFETAKYVAATGAELWRQQFKGPVNLADMAQAVAVDGSGNVVVTGSSQSETSVDYYTAKYAAVNGALLWEKRYNGPANHDDSPVAVAVDGIGNVVVTGYSNNESSRDNDFYTAKYGTANGVLLWERRYNGPLNDDDRPVALALDGNGNVAVAGSSYGNAGIETYTAKYASADGALLWENRHASYGAIAAAVDAHGNVVVAGASARLVKYAAADGSVLWERPAGAQVLAVAVDRSGNVAVTGFYSTGLNTGDYNTAKFAAATGALLWEKQYHGPGDYSLDQARSVAVDGSGNVVVTGYSQNVPGDDNVGYTAKYAASDGALLWAKRSPLEAAAVAVDGRGDVIVTGTSGATSNAFDYYTAKYAAADGALLWEKSYNGPAKGYDFTRSLHPLALGPNGIVAVTGYSSAFSDPALLFGGSSAYDYATVVYRELPFGSIERVPEGVRLRFFGEPGRVHQVWRSQSVPGRGSLIHQQSMPDAGSFEFTDTSGPTDTALYHMETLP